jgi:hypothetical protein
VFLEVVTFINLIYLLFIIPRPGKLTILSIECRNREVLVKAAAGIPGRQSPREMQYASEDGASPSYDDEDI